jgi:phosphatidylserine/phosphatidylglycerophosphate/cardiolipin synthase-like enzyme
MPAALIVGVSRYANRVTINAESGRAPKIFLYPHMSHAKVILKDDRIVAIGSANLTPRSMRTSKEVTLFVHGVSTSPFFRELREQLERDRAVSEEVAKPFKLGPLDKVMALVGKYLW